MSYKSFIRTHWKKLSLIGIIFFLFILITATILSSYHQIMEAEKNVNSVKQTFTTIALWKGNSGEVAKSFCFDDENLYIAMGYDGLYIFDKTNLSNKSIELSNYIINEAENIKTVSNTLLFLATGSRNNAGGILICSIESSNINVINSNLQENLNATGLYILEKDKNSVEIYISDEKKGFYCYNYDINKNYLSAKPLKEQPSISGVDIVSTRKHIFLADSSGNIHVFNSDGRKAGEIKNPLIMANHLFLYKDILFVADRMNGIVAYDVSSPENSKFLYSYNASGDSYDVFVQDEEVFVADGISGILNLKLNGKSLSLQKRFADGSVFTRVIYDKSKNLVYAACNKDGIRILK